MAKLSVDDLKKFQEKAAGELNKEGRTDLLICGGTGCHATGSIKVIDVTREEVKAKGLEDRRRNQEYIEGYGGTA